MTIKIIDKEGLSIILDHLDDLGLSKEEFIDKLLKSEKIYLNKKAYIRYYPNFGIVLNK